MDPEEVGTAFDVLISAVPGAGAVQTAASGVTVEEGEVLLGYDGVGQRHLLVPVPNAADVAVDSLSRGVQIRSLTLDRDFADVRCLDSRLAETFATMAADMLDAIQAQPGEPAAACHRVLGDWRALIERPRPDTLGRQRLAGLLAELLVLQLVAERSAAHALESWTGPANDRHDFRRAQIAIEVKGSLRREGRIVEIHGATQLEEPVGGELLLAVFRFEADDSGTHVPAVVRSLLAIGVPRTALFDQLLAVGYDPDRREYEEPRNRFRELERRFYRVTPDFPRLIPADLANGQLPAGVLNLRYDIDVTGEPPSPISREEIDAAVIELAEAGA